MSIGPGKYRDAFGSYVSTIIALQWVASALSGFLLLLIGLGAGLGGSSSAVSLAYVGAGWNGVVLLFGVAAALTAGLLARHLSRWLGGLSLAVTLLLALACLWEFFGLESWLGAQARAMAETSRAVRSTVCSVLTARARRPP